MKKEANWNNERRSSNYWLAIELLLVEVLNLEWWISSDDIFTESCRQLMTTVYGWLIPNDPLNLFSLILGLFTVHAFAIAAIALLNFRLGSLPDQKKDERLYQFTSKPAFVGDVILGVILEVSALAGILSLTDVFDITSIAFILFPGLLIWGSILYWKQVFPYKLYREAVKMLRHTDTYEDTVWFCLSNSENRCSTFHRVPRKGKLRELVVESDDLPRLVANTDGPIPKHAFCFYLIAIDFQQDITDSFMEDMQNIVNLPHATVLVCTFGPVDGHAVSERVTALLSDCQNVHIEHFDNQALTEAVDIEAILENSRLRKPRKVRAPFRIVEDAQLLQVYLNTGHGPKLCLDFMKLILNRLDVLPGVYALFDLIDLEYRITVAYDRNYSRQKLRRKAEIFGNITKMSKMIEKSVIVENDRTGRGHISAEQIFNSIISDKELALIRKYLPNYQIRLHEPGYNTIVYLASSLRNVLRGHGYFDHADANQLFELIFKIALMNACILTISDISLHITTIEEWQDKGYYKVNGRKEDGEDKQLSPFFVGTEQGSTLVFNNWNKATEHSDEAIEYINYLDGTLILPEFTNVALDK